MRFGKTKVSGEGLGLGLSTSFNIARDFNGGLRLAQSSREGTTFELILNVAEFPAPKPLDDLQP